LFSRYFICLDFENIKLIIKNLAAVQVKRLKKMKTFFKTKEAAVNYSRAMEADTILKNGRSSKSHTSRRNFYKKKGGSYV